MRIIITFILFSLFGALYSQSVADFEEFNLTKDTFNNGKDAEGGFVSGGVLLPNNYSPDFDAWTGWAISTISDTLSPGFANQYSCVAGMGAEGSFAYAVGYAFDPVIIHMQDEESSIEGLFICNATYPYLSMRDGDSFSKRFGGVSGLDPDYFRLTAKKYLDGILSEDSVDFYLADFRSDNSVDDYIVKDWMYLDLTPLGRMDSLQLSLSSSDVGVFGMNTPAYFCVDRILTRGPSTSLKQEDVFPLHLYPNPASDFIQFEVPSQSNAILSIFRFDGIMVYQAKLNSLSELDVRQWPVGNYQIQLKYSDKTYRSTFLKY